MLLSKRAKDKKKRKIKEQEANGLLNSLGIKIPLSDFFSRSTFALKI